MSQYLTVKLDRELYAVDLLDIQEIRGYSPATPLPNAPEYFRGVMNLRGVIVPVVDLRTRFGLASVTPTRLNVIVVVNVKGRTLGLIVDAVADVVELQAADISPPPAVAGVLPVDFIHGVARTQEQLVILLRLERVAATTDVPSNLAA